MSAALGRSPRCDSSGHRFSAQKILAKVPGFPFQVLSARLRGHLSHKRDTEEDRVRTATGELGFYPLRAYAAIDAHHTHLYS